MYVNGETTAAAAADQLFAACKYQNCPAHVTRVCICNCSRTRDTCVCMYAWPKLLHSKNCNLSCKLNIFCTKETINIYKHTLWHIVAWRWHGQGLMKKGRNGMDIWNLVSADWKIVWSHLLYSWMNGLMSLVFLISSPANLTWLVCSLTSQGLTGVVGLSY